MVLNMGEAEFEEVATVLKKQFQMDPWYACFTAMIISIVINKLFYSIIKLILCTYVYSYLLLLPSKLVDDISLEGMEKIVEVTTLTNVAPKVYIM